MVPAVETVQGDVVAFERLEAIPEDAADLTEGAPGLRNVLTKLTRRKDAEIKRVDTITNNMLKEMKGDRDLDLALRFKAEEVPTATVQEMGKYEEKYKTFDPDAIIAAAKRRGINTDKLLAQAIEMVEQQRELVNEEAKLFSDGDWVGFLEDYFPRYWKSFKGKPIGGKGVSAKSVSTMHAKQRTLPTAVEGIEQGGVLEEMGATEIISRYAKINQNALTNRTFMHLAGMAVNSDGDLMVSPRLGKMRPEAKSLEAEARTGWAKRISDALHKPTVKKFGGGILAIPADVYNAMVDEYRSTHKDYVKMDGPYGHTEELWVHPDAVNLMKNVSGSNKLEDFPMLQKVMYFNMWAKQGNLAFSMFHHFAMMENYLASLGPLGFIKGFNWTDPSKMEMGPLL